MSHALKMKQIKQIDSMMYEYCFKFKRKLIKEKKKENTHTYTPLNVLIS